MASIVHHKGDNNADYNLQGMLYAFKHYAEITLRGLSEYAQRWYRS